MIITNDISKNQLNGNKNYLQEKCKVEKRSNYLIPINKCIKGSNRN